MNSSDKPLVNRVAQSGIITLNLEDYFPTQTIHVFDIKDYLFRELILKEKDFRDALAQHDFQAYQDQVLCVFCSTDAIIPVWAYQLVALHAQPFAADIFTGTPEQWLSSAYREQLHSIAWEDFTDRKVVIKGCSDKPVPPSAYAEAARRLRPFASSIMYGEPCSTVPLYKTVKK